MVLCPIYKQGFYLSLSPELRRWLNDYRWIDIFLSILILILIRFDSILSLNFKVLSLSLSLSLSLDLSDG